ncbi:hypothetical protein JST97_16105 [bacterium]|nr:hypothetical protein [bacterium]
MERISSATPPAAKNPPSVKKTESSAKPAAKKAVSKDNGPGQAAQIDSKQENEKKHSVSESQQAAHDFDLALAALHAGDYDSAAALVEKLRRSGQSAPNSYGLAAVQLGLLIQEGKDCEEQHKIRSALQAFAKQARPAHKDEVQVVDRSV